MAVQTIPSATLLLALILAAQAIAAPAKPPPKFPAIFAFGDSTVDSGNNNFLPTLARSDHSPYGHDFPNRAPTGRFSDGKLVPDLLATTIGLKEAVPPFLDPNLSDDDILTGVNFASSGSGFDELTELFCGATRVTDQVKYFKNYTKRLEAIAGEEAARRIVGEAVVIVSAAGNDFLINFYDLPSRKLFLPMDKYQDFVLDIIQDFVKQLYQLGCRRILVAGIPPIGSVPIQKTIEGRSGAQVNKESRSYNGKLKRALASCAAELPGSKILYIDIFNPMIDMINNPNKYGFEETETGCCGLGHMEIGPLCCDLVRLCEDPSKYVFFDAIHPTEAAYKVISQNIAQTLLPQL